MKAGFVLLAAGAVLALASSSLSAAPIAPAGVSSNSGVILVAEGCGRGWHRGPYGGCQRNVSPRWPCWYVRGPYGRWRLICH
jgi:hypothetical protein